MNDHHRGFLFFFLLGLLIGFIAGLAFYPYKAGATYKPEFANNSAVMTLWFQTRELTPAAQLRLTFQGCCNNADRFKTKFIVNKENGEDQWCYVLDGQCLPIAPDVIHDEPIEWPKGHEGEDPEGLRQLRAEGVLFLHNGVPLCFWPPESGQ